jgi:hypothetical protein
LSHWPLFIVGGPLLLVGGVGKDKVASAKVLRKAGFQMSPD